MKRYANSITIILVILFVLVWITPYKAEINVSISTLSEYMGDWYETTGNDIELNFATNDETGSPEITLSLLGTEGYEITDLGYDQETDTYFFVGYTKYLDRDDENSNTAIGEMWLYGSGIQMEIHYTSNPNAQSYVNCTFYFARPDEGENAGTYTNESGNYDPYTEELKAFFGVWVDASRTLAYSTIYKDNMYLPLDYRPQIILSSEWGNLNSDPWFCVTIDKFETQEAAEEALANVQYIYEDAYVRYSGDYIG